MLLLFIYCLHVVDTCCFKFSRFITHLAGIIVVNKSANKYTFVLCGWVFGGTMHFFGFHIGVYLFTLLFFYFVLCFYVNHNICTPVYLIGPFLSFGFCSLRFLFELACVWVLGAREWPT